MADKFKTAKPFLPDKPSFKAAREAVQNCKGCDLYKGATQAVFGEGFTSAKIVFVGEKPGDKEDIAGHPFVGPAGHLLDKAIVEAGLDRKNIFVTNAVKHFKWILKGKRRIHQKPSARQIQACQPWLDLEMQLIKPEYLVCLGATAAYAVFGRTIKIGENRGKLHITPYCDKTLVTVHPSAILRSRDDKERNRAFQQFVADLKLIAK